MHKIYAIFYKYSFSNALHKKVCTNCALICPRKRAKIPMHLIASTQVFPRVNWNPESFQLEWQLAFKSLHRIKPAYIPPRQLLYTYAMIFATLPQWNYKQRIARFLAVILPIIGRKIAAISGRKSSEIRLIEPFDL